MKIIPIQFNNFISTYQKTNNHNGYSQYPVLGIPSLPASLTVDTVNFKGATQPADIVKLKKLLAYKIPDMYSGRIMIDPAELETLMQAKTFSKPLKILVPILEKYEQSLFPVELEIFKMIKKDAKKYPQMKLDEAIHRRIIDAMPDLMGEQVPIFQELSRFAQQLPKPQLKKFNELMQNTENRLYGREVLVPFSAKDFKYKLERINEGIKARGLAHEIAIMRKLINMAQGIPEKASELSKTKHQGKNSSNTKMVLRDNIPAISSRLRQMQKVLLQSSLRRDKQLNELMENVKLRLYDIPMILPFGRKDFLYNLNQILAEINNPKLVRDMQKIATKLPTAKELPAAFIVKSSANSAEKIGYDLICNSVGTAEHLLPSKSGGFDYMSNIGLASFLYNNERGHSKMETQLKKHPETYTNCQKYIDRLIELYNDGTFKNLGISKAYIEQFAIRMRNLSSKSKPLILDLSKLKD